MGVATARKQDLRGRSLAVGAALAALAAGALTMTDRAMAGPGEVVSTIPVSGTSGVISDVNVLTQIEHAFPRDLEILLTGPDGTTVPLSTRSPEVRLGADPETTNVFSNTLWDDQANDPVTMHTGYANNTPASPLTPEGALGAFVGKSANGDWKLTIRDVDIDVAGTLNGWSLQLETGGTGGPTSYSPPDNTTATVIPENPLPGISSTITVPVTETGKIWDLNLRTNIAHTAPGDLVIKLTSPALTTVYISNRRGFDYPDGFAAATWDDSGLENITDFPGGVPEGPLVPESAMSVFRGEDITGVWTLSVEDDGAEDTGMLNSWGLDFQRVDEMPTTSPSSPSNPETKPIPDFTNDPPPPGPDPVVSNPGTGTPAQPATGSAAAATSGGPLVAAGPGKLAPRSLSLAVTKRDSTAPYKVSVSGKLKLPAGVNACFGKVTVTAKAGRTTAAVKKVALRAKGAACTYKTVFTFKSKPKGLPKSGTLKITARFPGNATLRAKSGGAKTVKLG